MCRDGGAVNSGANRQEVIKYIKSSRIGCAGFVVSVAEGEKCLSWGT